ncbi:hypothetical protein [Marinobacter sp.]|uniref:hypothetical protein n=1 Tax=Marinobacter sp. TaxID=50741 RepID=UPI003A907C33
MISVELDESNEGLEIYLDAEGVDELISYLTYVKANKESFHLTAGNELQENLANESNRGIKHAKLVFLE